MNTDLGSHHRRTIEKIFSEPSSGNVEWREVLSLLEGLGSAAEKPNGKVEVTLGSETEVLERPHGKDVDVQMLVDLRRMLAAAGYEPRLP